MTSDERAVLSANSAFYTAFRAHDLVAMDILWSHDANVQCVHPGWSPIEGREQVLQTFQAIFSHGAVVRWIAVVSTFRRGTNSMRMTVPGWARSTRVESFRY